MTSGKRRKGKERNVRKRIIAILLVFCLVAPLLWRSPIQTEAATDQYGFSTEPPEEFNPKDGKNPYGKGYTALNPIMEPFVFRSSKGSMNVDYWNDVKPQQGVMAGTQVSLASRGSQSEADFVVSRAYNPDGQGHDYMVAMVGLKNNDIVVWNYNIRTKQQGPDYTIDVGGGDNSDWFDDIAQWEYTSFFNLTAGDFDGDGDDEVAVYIPQRGNPRVRILQDNNGTFTQVGNEISYSAFMGADANISGEFNNDGRTKRAMVQASLEAADLDRDGKDELLMLGSFANLHENDDTKKITDRSSALGIYKMNDSGTLAKWGDTFRMNDGAVYLRSASCAAGDIDYNGFPEIVVAGYYSTGASNDSLNGSQFAVMTLAYDTNTGKMSKGAALKVDMNGFVKDGLYTGDNIQAPPALTCVAINGRNDSERMFLEGSMYQFKDSEWAHEHTYDKYTKSDDGINGYIISNTWMETAVAGNFDGNDLGIEQVYYTTGYKQMSLNYFFYNVNVMGKTTKHEGEQQAPGNYYDNLWEYVRYHNSGGDHLFVALAAVDADDDTDTMVYSRKEYTYTNVNVLAILQAAPYFEDLMDEYPDGVGSTSFEKVEGSGGSESTTKSAAAGAYISGEKSILPGILSFTAEASYSHEWEWEYEQEKSIEYGVNFEGGFMEDSVVLYRTPVTLYYYDVHPARGGETYSMTVGIQDNPVYSVMEMDEYNTLAAQDDAMKDKVISDSVLGSTPGQPSTYKTSAAGLTDFTGAKDFVSCSSGTTTAMTSQSITTGETSSASQSYNNSFELKVGLSGGKDNVFSIGGGVSGGGGWGGGSTTFEYNNVTKAGTVASPPSTEYPYSFQWKFGTWRANVGDTEVPVLGYLVRNVVEPPSLPKNIAVDTVTQDSITLSWEHGARRPVSYEIYQYFEDSVADSGYSLIATLDGEETSFTYEDLEPSSDYTFAIRSVGVDDNGDRVVSEYSSLVAGTTLKDGPAPEIHSISDDVRVSPGDTASFTVDATPSQGVETGLTYSWQKRVADSTVWENIGGSSSTLTLKNVTKDMDGNRYRCVVSEVHNGRRAYSYSEARMLTVDKADSQVTVSALNESKNTGSADYSISETIKENVNVIATATVTTPETVGADGGIKEENVTETYQIYENKNVQSGENTAQPEYIYRSQSDDSYYILENLMDGSEESGQTATRRILLSQPDDYFAWDEEGSQAVEGLSPDRLTGTEQQIYEYDGPEPAEGSGDSATEYLCWQAEQKDGEGEGQGVFVNLYAKNEAGISGRPRLYQMVDGVMTLWTDEEEAWTDGVKEWTDEGGYLAPEPVYSSNPGTEIVDGVTYEVWQDWKDSAVRLYQKTDEQGVVHYYQKVEDTSSGEEPEIPPTGEGEEGGEEPVTGFIMKEIYLIVPTGLADASGTYNVLPEESAVTVQEERERIVYTAVSGDPVTLSADVASLSEGKSVDGGVTFQMVNNRTGDFTAVSADVTGEGQGTATATWTPVKAGNYTITATFGGNEMLNSSSGTASYFATDGPEGKVGYVLQGESSAVYGDSLSLAIKEARTDEAGNVTLTDLPSGTSVVYKMQYKKDDGNIEEETLSGSTAGVTCTPKKPGDYTFTAQVGDDEATCYVNVLKRPVTFTAPSRKGISSTDTANKIPKLSEVKTSYTGDAEKTAILDTDAEAFRPETLLTITSRPELTVDSGANDYITGLAYQTEAGDDDAGGSDAEDAGAGSGSGNAGKSTEDAGEPDSDNGEAAYTETVRQFLDKYDATMENGLYNIVAGVRSVSYESGANGTLRGYYGDNQAAFDSGASLTEGTKITFVADAHENFQVKEWTVTDGEGQPLTEGEDYTVSGNRLIVPALKKETHVQVSFEPASYRLTFSASENGGITVQYIKDGEGSGAALTSPEIVAAGKSVRLSAAPDNGYVVKQWTVTEGSGTPVIRRNADGSIYAGDTLDLERLTADTTVQVEFEPEEFYTVETSVVDDEGNTVPGCEITVDGLSEDGTARRGSSLTFTAKLPDTNIVREWRVYDAEGDYEVVSGNAGTYTVSNVQENLRVEILVSEMKTYQLHFEAVDEDGSTVDIENVLRASWNGTELENGTAYTAYIPVDFTTSLPEEYQVKNWTLRQGGGGETVVAEGKDAVTYTLASLSDETWVTVHLEKRPTLTYEAVEIPGADAGNTVTCGELQSGSYLDKYRTEDIVLTVSPGYGYEIDTVLINDKTLETAAGTANADTAETVTGSMERVENSSDVLLTLTPGEQGFTEDVKVTVSFKPITPVTKAEYSLYDLGDGVHGTMQVSVERFGAEEYRQTTEEPAQSGSLTDIYRDSVITFTVTPDKGYEAAKWFVNGEEVTEGISTVNSDNDTFTYTVTEKDTEPVRVMAQLAQTGNKLTFGARSVLDDETAGGTVTAVNNRTGRPFYSGNTLAADSEVTFTAEAADGYEVVGWEMDGEMVSGETGNTFTREIKADSITDVKAVFDRLPYTVAWSATGGTVTAENATDHNEVSNGASVRGGREITFTAAPDAGMKFAGWKVDGITVPEDGLKKNPLTLTLEANVQVTAVFAQEPNCQVTFGAEDISGSENTGGSLSASLNGEPFRSGDKGAKGDKIVFTAAPDKNYRVKTWMVDGADTQTSEDSYTLTVSKESHEVRVIYELASGTVTFGGNDAAMGEVTARTAKDGQEAEAITSGTAVPSYNRVTFQATPAEGYLVEGWYSDASMTEESRIEGTQYEQDTYVIDSLYGDAQVYVKFEAIPSYEITVGTTGTGSGTLEVTLNGKSVTDIKDGTFTAPRHSTVSVTAVPHDEYSFLSAWNGVASDSLTYTIEDVTRAESVIAEFSPAELVEVSFEIPEGLEDQCHPAVAAGYGDDYTSYENIEAVGKSVQVLSGKNVRFTVTPPAGQMIDAWTVTYSDGSAVTGQELGLENALLLEGLNRNAIVSVSFREIEAWDVPEETDYDSDEDGKNDYHIENLVRIPDTLPEEPEYEDTIRDKGSVSFTLVPGEGKWITDIRLAGEGESRKTRSETGNRLSYTKNDDGSYAVTIENVTRDIRLQVDTVNYYTVSIGQTEHGGITARDNDGNVITDGTAVAEGSAVTFTATPDNHYRFAKWGGDAANTKAKAANRGEAVSVTLTDIRKDIAVSAEFAMTEHKNTEVRGAKEATCAEDGYTGDTYCADCGALVAKGQVIKATGHDYTQTASTDPTTQKEGTKTYTCRRCGHSYTESTEMLPKPIVVKPIRAGRNKNRLSWNKVDGADGYIILADTCNTRSKKQEKTVKRVKTVVSGDRTTWTHKKLKSAAWYKYQIKAFKTVNGKRVVISETPVVHAVTAGSTRYANPVKVKVNKTKISVKAGKKKKIKASVVLPKNRICQQHCDEIRYVVVDETIAAVNRKGVIKAKSKGTTTVYAIAQNGVSKKITVTVK